MTKKLTAVFIILHFIFLSGMTDAKPAKSPEDLAKEYLCNKMLTLVTGNIDDIDKYFSDATNSKKYMMFTKQNLLEDYLIAYAANDYAIEKVNPHVKIIAAKVEKNSATIEAVLKTDIYWNATNALNKAITGTKYENHTLILIPEEGVWKIQADKYFTERSHSDESIKEDYSKLSSTIERLKREAQDSRDRANRSSTTRLSLAFSRPRKTHNSANARDNKVYNRDEAYNWAHKYWHSYSESFVNLGDQPWKGGDCTNFVSQCLRAGGANNDKTGAYQWYYENKDTKATSDDSYSWTWSTAKGLNYILLGNYRTKEYGPKGIEKIIHSDIEYYSELGQFLTYGDLIQYEWSESTNIKHSAIIVDMVFNSSKDRYEPVISTHTADSWYLPWTKNAYRTHFIHVTGIN